MTLLENHLLDQFKQERISSFELAIDERENEILNLKRMLGKRDSELISQYERDQQDLKSKLEYKEKQILDLKEKEAQFKLREQSFIT